MFIDYKELSSRMKKVKSKMAPSERLEKYFAGEEVDHIPYSMFLGNEALCEIYRYKTGEMHANFNIYTEIIERKKEDFGMNQVNIGLGLRTLGAAMGSTLSYPGHGFDRIEKHILQSYSDWGKMDGADPCNNKILTPLLEKATKVKKIFPKMPLSTGVVGPLSATVAIRPFEKVLKDTRKNPEKLKELITLAVDNSLRWVEVFTKEIGTSEISIADPVTCTDILSRNQFEEFSFPELKRLVIGIKRITDLKPSLHICGHTKKIWEDLKKLEISSFSVDNCEDLAKVHETLGDSVTIVGNVPPVDVLKFGSIDDVIKSVKDCIKKGATSPKGYILSTGCDVAIGTPKENLEAYIYAAKTYGSGARIGKIPLGMK